MFERTLSYTRVAFALACLVFALTGCSSQLATYEVNGKVEFENGRPVVVGMVECLSVDHNINARGDIQPDGTFTLTTFEPEDGAVAGDHKCVVIQMVIGENMSGHRPSTVGVVDPKYASYQTSGLSIEVSPDGPNEIVLQVRGVKKQPAAGADHKH
ncbi:MAG: carboxypeptidase-like regulatory domain-containing protein [Aureliella sp.]